MYFLTQHVTEMFWCLIPVCFREKNNLILLLKFVVISTMLILIFYQKIF